MPPSGTSYASDWADKNPVLRIVSTLSQLFANKAQPNKVDQKMSLQFEHEPHCSVDECGTRSEIQKRDSSLRNIYESRLRLTQRLEENLALRRAILRRQGQSSAPVERSRLVRANGRMR
jgi:hypothetical protein